MSSTTQNLGLRLSSNLHDILVKNAAMNQRSLNAEIAQRLAESVTRGNDRIASSLIDLLNLPRFVRFRSKNTSGDVAGIVELCERLEVDDLLLAAMQDDLNHACLVAILQTPSLTCVIDTTSLNMAREPRIAEIEHLCQRLDMLGLLINARYCKQLVAATNKLAPVDAVATIVRDGEPAPMNLRAYLTLLSGHGLFDLERYRAQKFS